jgi:hypothetical protein
MLAGNPDKLHALCSDQGVKRLRVARHPSRVTCVVDFLSRNYAMIYELRHYVVVPGKGEAVLNRFKNHTFKIFDRRGFKVHDFWAESNGSGGRGTSGLWGVDDANLTEDKK